MSPTTNSTMIAPIAALMMSPMIATADVDTEAGQQPACNERADDAEDDIADQAEAAACHDLASQPAGNCTDDEKDDQRF